MDKNSVFVNASRGLQRHGLSPDEAWDTVKATRAFQETEWDSIIARCSRGDVARVYIVAARDGDNPPVVYAPVKDRDNVQHVAAFVGQGPVGADDPQLGYYPAAIFDVGIEVRRAVAIEQERDRVIKEYGVKIDGEGSA